MTATSTLVSALDPYISTPDSPWNRRRVQHLYLRLGFGANLATLDAGVAMAPDVLVDQLIDEIMNMPDPDPPFWATWSYQDYLDNGDVNMEMWFQHKFDMRVRWMREMMDGNARAKLALFWHNHFVAEEEVYNCNSSMWAYYDLLHKRATGNFRTFVEEMGLNPAMLVYLNGNQNVANEPNENYARELMELFTMGEGNGYTQDDIVEVAKALTGYRIQMYQCIPDVTFEPFFFNNSNKTIFGQTGNWNYDDVHELIFTQRTQQVAHHICEKLYKFYVYEKPDEDVVAAMAQCFIDNNWEIAPVLRELFKSAHFFSSLAFNTRIKSPVEVMANLYSMLNLQEGTHFEENSPEYLTYIVEELGQELFNPVDVAGWPEYHTWLNENTLTFRWSFSGDIVFGVFAGNQAVRDLLVQLALDLGDGEINDPEVLTDVLLDFFLNQDLAPEHRQTALQYFKGEVPENYFEEGLWNIYFPEAPYQILNLMYYLTRLPEWQLA